MVRTAPRERGKTDWRDAIKLARALRAGDLSAVYVPNVFSAARLLRSDKRSFVRRPLLRLRMASFINRRRIAHDRDGAWCIGENLAGD